MYQDYQNIDQQIIACAAMAAVALVIFLVMRSAHYLSGLLGASGIVAISRIIGFIVIAIGVQYISSSIVNIVQSIDFT
jgi:small neutral amino acid transporter SnatA (MarC family)